MSNLPKRIFDKLKSLENKFVRYPLDDKVKKLKQKYEDHQENRELVVVDKFGNRYYQYYSQHGLPTRRIVHLNMTSFNKWNDDPIMLSWLERRKLVAPTQEELEKEYIAHEEFIKRGIEWDKKERKAIEAYNKKRNTAIEAERKETKAIGEGETFEPGVWDRTQPMIVQENTDLIVEGGSSIPGKYMADFLEDDEKWIEQRRVKLNQPYLELLKDVDWNNYTEEKMVEKCHRERMEQEEARKAKKKEVTGMGKRSMERKKNGAYEKFFNQFKDVLNDKM